MVISMIFLATCFFDVEQIDNRKTLTRQKNRDEVRRERL